MVGAKQAVVIDGEDRVGALVDYAAPLAGAKINVTAADAVGGRFEAALRVKPAT